MTTYENEHSRAKMLVMVIEPSKELREKIKEELSDGSYFPVFMLESLYEWKYSGSTYLDAVIVDSGIYSHSEYFSRFGTNTALGVFRVENNEIVLNPTFSSKRFKPAKLGHYPTFLKLVDSLTEEMKL
ncbi:hypothetical protein HYZ41_02505 [archaeon]|nr:hypothetical protein [archaeon]